MTSNIILCLVPQNSFFTISRAGESGSYTVVYKSEARPGENPIWNRITICMNRLCAGDRDRSLQIQCFREGINGYHSDLGKYFTTLNGIMSQVGNIAERTFLIGKDGLETRRRILFPECKWSTGPTFIDYIRSGTQIHCCFAIDFTASNGDPDDPKSLHYISQDGTRTNPYEQAIKTVGEIVQDYDHIKNFPIYGFGAKIPLTGVVSHDFSVNFSQTPFCGGLDRVLEAYRNCSRQVQPGGPTHFAPIINNIAAMARENVTGQHYYILLIITDGIINDMPLTKQAIVSASTLLLSIIIVGVGKANFEAMNELDGDKVGLSYCGRYASRDIVQFVSYHDAQAWLAKYSENENIGWSNNLGIDVTSRLAKIKLAQEVLAEIPGQVTGFMKSRGIAPFQIAPCGKLPGKSVCSSIRNLLWSKFMDRIIGRFKS